MLLFHRESAGLHLLSSILIARSANREVYGRSSGEVNASHDDVNRLKSKNDGPRSWLPQAQTHTFPDVLPGP